MHSLLHSQKFPQSQPITCIDSNAEFIAAGSLSGSCSIWKLTDIKPWTSPIFYQPAPTPLGISDLKLSPSTNHLYISSLDSTLQQYHLQTDNTTTTSINTDLMTNYRLDINGDTLITAGEQGKLTIYDTTSLLKLQDLKTGDEFLNSLCKMTDGRLLATGNSTGTLHLVNLKKDNKLAAFPLHKSPIRGVKIIEERFEVVTVSDDKTVKVFDVAKEKVWLDWDVEGGVMAVDLNLKDENLLVTGGLDGVVRGWDLRVKGKVGEWEMGQAVWSLRYWRTGRTWMVGLEDGTFAVYSV